MLRILPFFLALLGLTASHAAEHTLHYCRVFEFDPPMGQFEYAPNLVDLQFDYDVKLIYTKFAWAQKFPYLRFYDKYGKQLPKYGKQLPKYNTRTWRGFKGYPRKQFFIDYFGGKHHTLPKEGEPPKFQQLRIKFRDPEAKLLEIKVCSEYPELPLRLPDYLYDSEPA